MQSKPHIWSMEFSTLFLINVVTYIGFQMLSPNITKYAAHLGADHAMLGMVSACFALSALLARPFSGIATDRLNKKMILVSSLLGMSLSFMGYAFSHHIALLLAARFLHGVCFGFNSTVAMAMASDALPDEKLASGIGIFSLGSVLSMAIAPAIGIWIVDRWGYSALFISAVVSTLFPLPLTLLIKNKPAAGGGPAPTGLLDGLVAKEALAPAAIGMMNACSSGAISGFIVLFGDQRGIANAGIYFTVYSLTLVAIRPLIGRLADRYPPAYLIVPCNLCIIVTMAVLYLSHSTAMLVLAGLLFGLGYGGLQPVLQSMCIKSVPKERRGAASGTYYIGLDAGNVLGPILCGWVAGVTGQYSLAFLSMAVPAALGLFVLAAEQRREREKAKNASVSQSY